MQVAAAKGVVEGGAAYVAHIVGQNAVFQSAGLLVLVAAAKVAALKRVALVHGVIVKPPPIAVHIVGSRQIDVAVAQFAGHVGEHFKQLFVSHLLVYHGSIAAVHIVPVQTISLLFIVEKAVSRVECLPQCLKIAPLVVVGHTFGYA